MITHYIYHIPGKKCGCTKNLESRKRWYKPEIRTTIVLLEELYDKTDQQAGDIEDKWNEHFGYPLGTHYAVSPTLVMAFEERREFFKMIGLKSAESMTPEQRSDRAHKAAESMTPEQRKENGRIGGRIGGRKSVDSKTPEQLSEWGRKAARIALETTTFEQRSEWGRMGGFIGGTSRIQVTCPHCCLKGNKLNLYRWHFDNCPHRPKGRIKRLSDLE